MKKYILFIVLFIDVQFSFSQKPCSVEQVALNYFVDSIWFKHFPKTRRIYFKGETDSTITTFYNSCIEIDTLFSNRDIILNIMRSANPTIDNNFYVEINYMHSKSIFNPKLSKPKKKVYRRKNVGNLNVDNSCKIRSSYYVYILFSSKFYNYVGILFELSNDCHVKHYCLDF